MPVGILLNHICVLDFRACLYTSLEYTFLAPASLVPGRFISIAVKTHIARKPEIQNVVQYHIYLEVLLMDPAMNSSITLQ